MDVPYRKVTAAAIVYIPDIYQNSAGNRSTDVQIFVLQQRVLKRKSRKGRKGAFRGLS